MPVYRYQCPKCTKNSIDHAKIKDFIFDDEGCLIFEIEHGISDDTSKPCPICGIACKKTMYGCTFYHYERGGYLSKAQYDKRVMKQLKDEVQAHKLATDDPYAGMRVPGEAEDLHKKLKGKKKQKTYFTSRKKK